MNVIARNVNFHASFKSHQIKGRCWKKIMKTLHVIITSYQRFSLSYPQNNLGLIIEHAFRYGRLKILNFNQRRLRAKLSLHVGSVIYILFIYFWYDGKILSTVRCLYFTHISFQCFHFSFHYITISSNHTIP